MVLSLENLMNYKLTVFFFFFYIHYKVEGIRHGLKASSAYLAHLYWISFGPGDPFGFSA